MPKISKPKEKKKKVKPTDFAKYYVAPHKKKSREIKVKDLPVVVRDANILLNLCFTPIGIYGSGEAVAHSQINDKDPLRFFVTKSRELIINPVITRHTAVKVDFEEGCLSFPNEPKIMVPRWNKIEAEFYVLDTESETGISDKKTVALSGLMAKVFQHEVDHLDGIYIYPIKK